MKYFYEFIFWLFMAFSVAVFIPHWIDTGKIYMIILDSSLAIGDIFFAIDAYIHWKKWRDTNGEK